ncbi:hypothetical protein BH23ACT11_BH23ACT11_28970 [soil metagenome]
MPYAGHTTEEVARRGRDLYEREIREKLEPRHAGLFMVLDVETGDYEVAGEDLEAAERLLARHPNALLYGQPVGTPSKISARIGGLPGTADDERV